MTVVSAKLFHRISAAVGGGLIAVALVLASSGASAAGVAFNSARDCDANAVMFCGAMSVSELQQKFTADSSIQSIYAHYGITSSAIQGMPTSAVAGQVTRNNEVLVNGKVIANNAVTEGRTDMPGSTKMESNGVVFYQRPPSVSFVSSPLDAFVVMNNNRFAFAILASCGNAVVATPVTTPTPKPTPKPTPTPTPTPTPKPTATPVTVVNNNTNINNVQQQQQQQQSAPPQAPAQSAAAQPAPAPAQTQTQTQAAPVATTLPNTGPGAVLGLFGGTLLTAGTGHYLYQRRKLHRSSL